MKLIEKIEDYKSKHRDTVEHTFKNGIILKAGYGIKLHQWLDNIYIDAVFEFKTTGTKNNANFLTELLK